MVKRFTYAIEPGGPKRVVIESQPMWQNCQIFFDGAVIGTIPGLDALMSGMNFTLPDDSVLRVIYTNKFLISQFQVLRNGKPLPGSQSDPNELLKTAVIVTYVVGAYDTLVGLLAGLVNIKLLLSMGGYDVDEPDRSVIVVAGLSDFAQIPTGFDSGGRVVPG